MRILDLTARTAGKLRRDGMSRFFEHVREKPSMQEIELIYIGTGWLTPTIILVMLGKLAEKAKRHPLRLKARTDRFDR